MALKRRFSIVSELLDNSVIDIDYVFNADVAIVPRINYIKDRLDDACAQFAEQARLGWPDNDADFKQLYVNRVRQAEYLYELLIFKRTTMIEETLL